MDAAKIASEGVAQKTAEKMEDIIVNKITSACKSENKVKGQEYEQMKYKKSIYHQKNVNVLLLLQDCFSARIKINTKKIPIKIPIRQHT